MVGESGQKKNGNIYRYYKCAAAKRKKNCDKKPVRKEWMSMYNFAVEGVSKVYSFERRHCSVFSDEGGDADEKLDRKGQKWEEDIRKKKKKRQSNYMKN